MTAAADLSQAHPAGGDLQRELGAWDLVLLGVGCIIGAGIFVLTGMAAALYAGPAIILSFIFAGIAAAFAGFCYAELAATMPHVNVEILAGADHRLEDAKGRPMTEAVVPKCEAWLRLRKEERGS